MANSWFRLWHDFTIDPKWRAIAHLSDKPLHMVQAIAVFLMSDASCNDMQRGATKCNALTVACATGCNEADVASVLQAMQGIILEGNVFINWDKRQPKREREQIQGSTALSSTERSRLRRERLKDATATDYATPCNAQDTDKDTDKIRKNNTPLSPPSEKPELELEIETLKPVARKRAVNQNLITPDFLEFWAAYPTADGRNKGARDPAAKKYHQALKTATHQQIMTGVQNYGTFIASTGTFNANASSWLNQKRWADDYTVTRTINPAAGYGRQPQQRQSAWERTIASGFQAVQHYRGNAELEMEHA
jgi:hypothetical protein